MQISYRLLAYSSRHLLKLRHQFTTLRYQLKQKSTLRTLCVWGAPYGGLSAQERQAEGQGEGHGGRLFAHFTDIMTRWLRRDELMSCVCVWMMIWWAGGSGVCIQYTGGNEWGGDGDDDYEHATIFLGHCIQSLTSSVCHSKLIFLLSFIIVLWCRVEKERSCPEHKLIECLWGLFIISSSSYNQVCVWLVSPATVMTVINGRNSNILFLLVVVVVALPSVGHFGRLTCGRRQHDRRRRGRHHWWWCGITLHCQRNGRNSQDAIATLVLLSCTDSILTKVKYAPCSSVRTSVSRLLWHTTTTTTLWAI